METVGLMSNQKGAIGEALILHGNTIPTPISDAIEEFVRAEYEVADNTPINISQKHETYLNASTGEGKQVSTRMDGSYSAKWIPTSREDDIDRYPDGNIRDQWELMSESAIFPIEIKTGEYAELERNQKNILETVSKANTRDHPLLIKVQIDKLPGEYELSTQFI